MSDQIQEYNNAKEQLTEQQEMIVELELQLKERNDTLQHDKHKYVSEIKHLRNEVRSTKLPLLFESSAFLFQLMPILFSSERNMENRNKQYRFLVPTYAGLPSFCRLSFERLSNLHWKINPKAFASANEKRHGQLNETVVTQN